MGIIPSAPPASKSSIAAALAAGSSYVALGVLGASAADQKSLIADLLGFEKILMKYSVAVFRKNEDFDLALKVHILGLLEFGTSIF